MGRVRLIIAWLLATAVAMGLAFGAVSIVAGDIADQPRELVSSTPSIAAPAVGETTASTVVDTPSVGSAESSSTTSSPPPTEDDSTSSTTEGSSSSTEGSSPSTTEDDSTSSTMEGSSPSTTEDDSSSSTDASSTTSTTLSTPVSQTVSYDGNWARFSCTGNVAGLEAYGAGTGYRLAEAPEISDDSGKVEFESTDGVLEVDFRVKCDGGTIETWADVEN
jgi:hypothetical protein